jgi:hypothetical protein
VGKIRQVTTRDYINPKIYIDFCDFFIPNECFFSFIYESMMSMDEAMRQKWLLADRLLYRDASYGNKRMKLQITKKWQKIIGHIRMFDFEFHKNNKN